MKKEKKIRKEKKVREKSSKFSLLKFKNLKQKSSKYSLLKVIGIVFLLFAVLTWIIPAGAFSGATYNESSAGTSPVGILGLFINPVYSFGIFAQYFLVFLSIGGFYGVLNQTGVYNKLVNKISNMFKKIKTLCLILTTVLFALFTSLIGSPITMFILVPFAVAVMLKLGFNKLTSIAATAGAILVGMMGSIFGTDVVFISFFGTEMFSGIIEKIIFFVVITLIYLLFLLYQTGVIKIALKKKKKDKEVSKGEVVEEKILDIPLYENVETKKSIVPLIIILIATILVIFIGVFNWEYTFGVTLFSDFYTKMTEIKILNKLFGYLPAIGYFGNYDVAAILLVSSFIIKWIYSIRLDDFIESFVAGVKKMIKPAVYVILASAIFAVMVNGSYNISATITNWLLKLNKDFFVLIITVVGYIGSFFFNDFPYLVNSMYGALATFDSTNYTIMGIILQASYGLAMLSLPVSVVLVGGLSYLGISYKEWMKYIYKFLLAALIIIVIFSLIVLAI